MCECEGERDGQRRYFWTWVAATFATATVIGAISGALAWAFVHGL